MSGTQNYANHRRFFPLQHFVVAPLLTANFVLTARRALANPTTDAVWAAVLSLALILLAMAARMQALTVQDRLIRLEVRLRAERLLPAAMFARFGELRKSQWTALRFAGDKEFTLLYERCLNGELTSGNAIKRAITDWQEDTLRV